MPSRVFEYERVVEASHIDGLGHVNNARYVEFLEEARWDLVIKSGLNIQDMMAQKMGFVALELSIKFKHELRLGEKIKVVTQVKERKGKVFVIEQRISNEKGQDAADALITMAQFDLGARKIVDPTPEWLAALGLE